RLACARPLSTGQRQRRPGRHLAALRAPVRPLRARRRRGYAAAPGELGPAPFARLIAARPGDGPSVGPIGRSEVAALLVGVDRAHEIQLATRPPQAPRRAMQARGRGRGEFRSPDRRAACTATRWVLLDLDPAALGST